MPRADAQRNVEALLAAAKEEFAAQGVDVPFVAGVVDCDGTSVKGNVVNTPPDPEHVTLGMRVRLTTVPVGTDSAGVEAVGYGSEPVS